MKATILFALFALFAMFALAPAAASEVAVVEADEVADEVAVADEVDAEDEEEETAEEESEEEADEESEAEAEEEETAEESEEAFIEAGADSSCLKGFSGSKLASTAASYQAAYKKAGIKYSQPKRSFGARPKSGFSDCSSFVNSVLQATGYACIFKGGENTANMNSIIRTKGGYKPFPAAAGDIVMWSGHTGIVTKVCSKTTAEMVAMGNSGCKSTGCVTIPVMKKWGGGTFLGFWTPRA